jgi:hypothetical protein
LSDENINPFSLATTDDMTIRSITPRTQHATSGICGTRRNRRCSDHLDERLKAVSVRQGRDFEILKDRFALCGSKLVEGRIAPELSSVLFLPRVTR